MVRPLLLAEPGPGDASCTTWTLSAFFHPLHLQAGRPSSRFALRSDPVFRPLPSFLRSQPCGWWASCNGGSKLPLQHENVKALKAGLRVFISTCAWVKNYNCMNRNTSWKLKVFFFAIKRMKLIKNDTKLLMKYFVKKNPEKTHRVFS